MNKDSQNNYGVVAKLLHWGSALVVFGLFAVGFWMVDLTYYSEWYKTAPHWHKSIGLLLALVTVFRIAWKIVMPSPAPLKSHSRQLVVISKLAHSALYLLLIILFISGYLISTADGRGIAVFDWFTLASLGELINEQEDIAGVIHKYTAYSLIGLVVIHAFGAIKHHVIDKDNTLKRMI